MYILAPSCYGGDLLVYVLRRALCSVEDALGELHVVEWIPAHVITMSCDYDKAALMT